MSLYKSALGKTVDMGALVRKNENVRAVSNVRGLNARGDSIDSSNNVVKPVTSKVNEMYAKTIGNKSAQVQAQAPIQVYTTTPKTNPPSEPLELTAAELELELDLALEESIIAELKSEEVVQEKPKSRKKNNE